MARVVLLHGIHTQGPAPIEGLIPYLEEADYEVLYPDYGYILGVETKLINPCLVGMALPFIQKDDWIIAHSNGCALGWELMHQGAPASRASFINPALDPDVLRPNNIVRWIDVYSNKGDEITEVAELGQRIGVLDPVWGEMGHSGYKGNDPVFFNVYADATTGEPRCCGHSDWFTPAHLAGGWALYMIASDKRTR